MPKGNILHMLLGQPLVTRMHAGIVPLSHLPRPISENPLQHTFPATAHTHVAQPSHLAGAAQALGSTQTLHTLPIGRTQTLHTLQIIATSLPSSLHFAHASL